MLEIALCSALLQNIVSADPRTFQERLEVAQQQVIARMTCCYAISEQDENKLPLELHMQLDRICPHKRDNETQRI